MAAGIFIKIGDLQGESVDSTHRGEIDVIDWHWGMSQAGSAHAGTGAGSGKVNVKDLLFTKYSDKSSPNLIKLCCSGKHFESATLVMRKAAGSRPLEYIKVVLKDVLVAEVKMAGRSRGDRLTETVQLNFASFTYEYVPQGADGASTGAIPASWNIATNSPT